MLSDIRIAVSLAIGVVQLRLFGRIARRVRRRLLKWTGAILGRLRSIGIGGLLRKIQLAHGQLLLAREAVAGQRSLFAVNQPFRRRISGQTVRRFSISLQKSTEATGRTACIVLASVVDRSEHLKRRETKV